MYAALAAAPGREWIVQALDAAGAPVGQPESVRDAPELVRWERLGPRWLWDSADVVYPPLVAAGVRLNRCHDVAMTERLLLAREGRFGEPLRAAAIRARAAGLPAPADPGPADPAAIDGGLALFPSGSSVGEPDEPFAGASPVQVLGDALTDQMRRIERDPALRLLIAADSASALAAVEMSAAGLPWDAAAHAEILQARLGPRVPAGERPVRLAALAVAIDDAFGFPVNPDSATDLRGAFARVGYSIDSTRSSAIRSLDHPAVEPVLAYRELARLHAANGWPWLDEWVRNGRLHTQFVPAGVVSGRWATRGGGGLQIPRILRAAVRAEPGFVLVVADAAQLEPRVLAAISGDEALARVAAGADLYDALAADGFGGDRARAKLAMLGAMYGATSGEAGRLLGTLRNRYPAAMAYVQDAADAGERGGVVRSVLGRTSPPPPADWMATVQAGAMPDADDHAARRARRVAADRGRFTRNFVVQASAADWAAVWLSVLRQDLRGVEGAEVVFFQHDELIVHARSGSTQHVQQAIVAAAERARALVFRGAPVPIPVRPVAVQCYADAK